MPQPTEYELTVTAEDPKKPEEKKDSEKAAFEGLSKLDDTKDSEDMSEEDLQLKNELEMLVERLKESNTELYRPALETLRTLIRTSTSSMTSVPKPLKFLRPHYPELQKLYDAWPSSEDKSLFADILSVLAMTYSDTEPRGTLRYRLLAASMRPTDSPLADPGNWGHEYVRHIAAELGEEYSVRETPEEGAEVKAVPLEVGSIEDLRTLAKQCAIFLLGHNAEPDAVDLLEELEIVNELVELVDENTYGRVCQYMIRCVTLLPPPDDRSPSLFAWATKNSSVKTSTPLPTRHLMKRQLAFMLARASIPLVWLQPPTDEDGDADVDDELPQDLIDCLSNTRLSASFRDFGKEVGVAEAKSLEDVYKTHLENTRPNAPSVDSARANLAGTFVNAFVNAGFGNDKLMVEADEGNSWIYKNKDHGMMSAAASLGLSLLWDSEVGVSHVDKYTYSAEEHIKAGALLATGILHCGVRTDADTAAALLSEQVENKSVPLKTAAIMGLALAYAGSQHPDLLSVLLPHVADDTVTMEISSLAALALGFIYVGSENGEITGTILQTLMERAERSDGGLEEKWGRFMVLGLGMLYLGLQEASDATIETLKAIEHPLAKTAQVIVDACAYAGTGNVLKKEKEKEEKKAEEDKEKKEEAKEGAEAPKEPKDDTFQAFAVIGVALIAMGEEVGAEMSLRQFNHLMHYGEPVIRRSVPLAIGLVSTSNPQLPILDTLSKYSHDNDLHVALNAIFAMGLVGAGTNNARLAQMLRQLAGYYYKEPDCLFMVRVAQGLVHMGKGTIGLNPFFADRTIMGRPAVAGLLATLTAFTDAKGFIMDKYHWMLYFLTPAMFPRFLITLDEELNPLPVTVRVGQAVDVVGQAGKPRTISGFQTHQTPVRLGTTERAELATEEFFPYASVLEGFVILHKNPGYEKEDKMEM
ncbi:armadillo-type protein [Schizophyllum amplum]|uniref:26S proteasome regulatory subunit RPN1 n=1 Tax=Schizophyllum amplum TaxID=97359 RepID=A0A550C694_9AGAR|nr:armadillo-type protein [Auriculariopsis ampla]